MGIGKDWEVKKDVSVTKNKVESEPTNKRKGYAGGFIFALIGWVCALISFLPFTAFIAALGIVFGFLSYKLEKREIQGIVIMIISAAGGFF
ncbi:hypothetical protein PUW25_08505 [Paenibacillus urinalis]|uniref:DUF4190 domain-containing protein n=1 Tax=Paenibacillus urinalis TaxID=521520 RepID=A0ABY7XJZ1_9BACL|nr:hypothetical protein [Paenibacillus urinalis]WDI03975.1 hypothetical protein PUW25_08505 [Paenibacillus urinalis]